MIRARQSVAADPLEHHDLNKALPQKLLPHVCPAMNYRELDKSALELNELYERLETKRYGRAWTTQELALGFVGDVGDLAKLIQAHAGVRVIDEHKSKLGHELSDCLWSVIVIANKCGIDLEAEFSKNIEELKKHVSKELDT